MKEIDRLRLIEASLREHQALLARRGDVLSMPDAVELEVQIEAVWERIMSAVSVEAETVECAHTSTGTLHTVHCRDCGSVKEDGVWLPVGALHRRIQALETERDRSQARARYLRACAHLFPHVNTDSETCTQIGVPDSEDVWCLGCTVGSVIEEFDDELLQGEDEAVWNERARTWVRSFERVDQ